jgi:hypothetical protein
VVELLELKTKEEVSAEEFYSSPTANSIRKSASLYRLSALPRRGTTKKSLHTCYPKSDHPYAHKARKTLSRFERSQRSMASFLLRFRAGLMEQ